MPKPTLRWLVAVGFALQLACGDGESAAQPFSNTAELDAGSNAGAKSSSPNGASSKSSGAGARASAGAGGMASAAKQGPGGTGGKGGSGAPGHSAASAGRTGAAANGGEDDAGTGQPAAGKVSRPGEYRGYSDKLYSGHALSSEYVEVRDGTKLAVDLYRPTDKDGKVVSTKLPVLWMHTPYNRRYFTYNGMRGLSGETYPGAAARLVEYGYVVAIVDFRGLYASYGQNVAYNRGEWVDAAHWDAYDITEWLAQQPWSSGQIGMWGCSATGGSQLQATTTAPPSLKAVFPMSCEFDAYPFGVPGGMAPAQGDTRAPPATVPSTMRDQLAVPVDADTDRSQLMQAIASHAEAHDNPGYVPFRDSVAQNVPEQWWIKSSPHTYLKDINASGIAMYLAANWDEAATKYGPFFTLNNVTNPVKLIVGPSTHCAWFNVQDTTGFDISVEELRYFDHWLKGIDNGVMQEPKVYYYTYGKPKGQEWAAASAWPLPNERRVAYYFGAGSLSDKSPDAAEAKDDFGVSYEAPAAGASPSGLVYETAALDKALQITGHPVVDLWLASTAADSDVIATLQNVAPDGSLTSYNMHGRLRASQRKEAPAPYNNLGLPWHPFGEADAQPLLPGEPAELRFDMLPISMLFESGHKLRLVISFVDANTPRLDPSPTVSVYRDAAHPSMLSLPVVDP